MSPQTTDPTIHTELIPTLLQVSSQLDETTARLSPAQRIALHNANARLTAYQARYDAMDQIDHRLSYIAGLQRLERERQHALFAEYLAPARISQTEYENWEQLLPTYYPLDRLEPHRNVPIPTDVLAYWRHIQTLNLFDAFHLRTAAAPHARVVLFGTFAGHTWKLAAWGTPSDIPKLVAPSMLSKKDRLKVLLFFPLMGWPLVVLPFLPWSRSPLLSIGMTSVSIVACGLLFLGIDALIDLWYLRRQRLQAAAEIQARPIRS